MVLESFVEVRGETKNNKGSGIFCSEALAANTRVWYWDKNKESIEVYTRDAILAAPPHEREVLARFSYMIDDDSYASTLNPHDDPSYYFNHSCDPNCWYVTRYRGVRGCSGCCSVSLIGLGGWLF
jgi:hypothetical protein